MHPGQILGAGFAEGKRGGFAKKEVGRGVPKARFFG